MPVFADVELIIGLYSETHIGLVVKDIVGSPVATLFCGIHIEAEYGFGDTGIVTSQPAALE